MKYNYKEWQQRVCNKLGHDWAYQDQDKYMLKICMRCGAQQIFFPEEGDGKIWGQTWSDD